MKADTAKFTANRGRYRYSDLRRGLATVRQQAFTASFIDRRTISIRHYDAKPFAPGCDRRRQASRPTANYKYICIKH